MSRAKKTAPIALPDMLSASRESLKAGLCAGADIRLRGAWYWRPRPGADRELCLVAHVDTVHDRPPRPRLWGGRLCFERVPAFLDRPAPAKKRIYHDARAGVWWSPDGLGADDRAGVWAVLALRERTGCAVLLTDGEESGGIGAHEAVASAPMSAAMHTHKALVEIDRRGRRQAVFYSPVHPEFRRRVVGWGFEVEVGSFSDISVLGPAWEMDSVNVSAGYVDEHSDREHLVERDLLWTVETLAKVLGNF